MKHTYTAQVQHGTKELTKGQQLATDVQLTVPQLQLRKFGPYDFEGNRALVSQRRGRTQHILETTVPLITTVKIFVSQISDIKGNPGGSGGDLLKIDDRQTLRWDLFYINKN